MIFSNIQFFFAQLALLVALCAIKTCFFSQTVIGKKSVLWLRIKKKSRNNSIDDRWKVRLAKDDGEFISCASQIERNALEMRWTYKCGHKRSKCTDAGKTVHVKNCDRSFNGESYEVHGPFEWYTWQIFCATMFLWIHWWSSRCWEVLVMVWQTFNSHLWFILNWNFVQRSLALIRQPHHI